MAKIICEVCGKHLKGNLFQHMRFHKRQAKDTVAGPVPVEVGQVVEPAVRPRPFMGPIHITIERPDGTFIRIEE